MKHVDITFKTAKLELLFHDDLQLTKKWGHTMARSIRRRLDDLRAAQCLDDMRGLPGTVASADANAISTFFLTVQHPHRLIFELVDERPKRGAGLDWAQITSVCVLGIEKADE